MDRTMHAEVLGYRGPCDDDDGVGGQADSGGSGQAVRNLSAQLRTVGDDELLRRHEELVRLGLKVPPEGMCPPGFESFMSKFEDAGIFCSCGIVGAFFCNWKNCRDCRKVFGCRWGPLAFPFIRNGHSSSARAMCAVCFGRLRNVYHGIPFVGCSAAGEVIPDADGNVYYDTDGEMPDGMRCKDCSRCENRGHAVDEATGKVVKIKIGKCSHVNASRVAKINATCRSVILRSFGHDNSFYHDLLQEHNVAKLRCILRGEHREIEEIHGMVYPDREWLQLHIAVMCYTTLAFRGASAMPVDLPECVLQGLGLGAVSNSLCYPIS